MSWLSSAWNAFTGKTAAEEGARAQLSGSAAERQFFVDRVGDQRLSNIANLYGSGGVSRLAQMMNPQDLEALYRRHGGDLLDHAGQKDDGSYYTNEEQRARQLQAGQDAVAQLFADAGEGFLGKQDRLAQAAMSQNDPMRYAREFGRGAEANIREGSRRDLESANARSRAMLAGAGFGTSTAAANQEANNQADAGYRRDMALTDLYNRRSSMQMNAAGQNRAAQLQHIYGQGAQEGSILFDQPFRSYTPQFPGVSPAAAGAGAQANALQGLFGTAAGAILPGLFS